VSPGPTALLAAILASALEDAGLLNARHFAGHGLAPPRPATAYAREVARDEHRRRAVAVAWLLGELDGAVPLPVTLACAALDLDPAALAVAVRRRCA
jgi:hypothetical protein